jgi:hypothetical protein
MNIEQYNPETFEPHVGSMFRAEAAGDVVPLQLAEVKRGLSTPRVLQFSLFFKGPLQPFLPQQTVHFKHDVLGDMDLFIVPVGKEESGFIYQVVFTRLTGNPPAPKP